MSLRDESVSGKVRPVKVKREPIIAGKRFHIWNWLYVEQKEEFS